MFASSRHPRTRHVLLLLLLMFALVVVAPRPGHTPAARAAAATGAHVNGPAGMAMSDEAMRQMVLDYSASHPQHVSGPAHLASPLAAPVDSFTAVNFRFEHDGNAATQVDTATIQAGQTIRFKWGTGFHTCISGTGSSDPDVGTVFSHNLQSAADNFDVTIDTPGTYPFFCSIHESSGMKGIIVVNATASVPAPRAANVGFVSPLAPNPTSRGVSFRIALAQAGHARVDVFDTQGRHIATPLDGEFAAGTFSGSWNGLDARGGRVKAGVYSLRLRAPGLEQTRQLVYTR